MRVSEIELFAVPPRRLFLKLSTDEERVRAAAPDARMWHNPQSRNDDGTVTEW